MRRLVSALLIALGTLFVAYQTGTAGALSGAIARRPQPERVVLQQEVSIDIDANSIPRSSGSKRPPPGSRHLSAAEFEYRVKSCKTEHNQARNVAPPTARQASARASFHGSVDIPDGSDALVAKVRSQRSWNWLCHEYVPPREHVKRRRQARHRLPTKQVGLTGQPSRASPERRARSRSSGGYIRAAASGVPTP